MRFFWMPLRWSSSLPTSMLIRMRSLPRLDGSNSLCTSFFDFRKNFFAHYTDPISPDRNRRWKRQRLSGADREASGVQRTLDHVAIDHAVRERSLTMRAGVVGNEKFVVEIVHCERRQTLDLHPLHRPRRHSGNLT